jgi:hypothetical protein
MLRALVPFVLVLAGCFDPAYPSRPFFCTAAEPDCPSGYHCDLDGGVCTNGTPTHVTKTCSDEDLEKPPGTNREDNDTRENATPLVLGATGASLVGLEICTPEDVDYYSFTLSAQKKVTLTVSFTRADGELSAALVDAADNVAAAATASADGLRAEATMGPGACYAKIWAGPQGTANKYSRMEVAITAP